MKQHFGQFQQASGTVHTTQHSMQILQCSEKGLEEVGYDNYVACVVFMLCVKERKGSLKQSKHGKRTEVGVVYSTWY
jgi:hypothetical protein